MSTAQRNDACLLAVDPVVAETLRLQTLVTLEANHYYFEDLLEFGAEAQFALSVIYRDAFAVLDAIGWSTREGQGTIDVPLTTGHVEQLRRRRYDLAHANLDRLPEPSEAIPARILRELDAGRRAIRHLDSVIASFDDAGRSELQ